MSTLLSRFGRSASSIDGVAADVIRVQAQRIARGIDPKRGERVAILVPPGPDFVAAFFGVLIAGGVVVVLSPLHPPPETLYFCEHAGVRLVLVGESHAELAHPLRASFDVRALAGLEGPPRRVLSVADDEPALQLYTSGTTGRPKGAVITHENLAVQQALLGAAWAFGPADTLLHALPLHHMHGLAIALLTAHGASSRVHMIAFESRRAWEAMNDATVFMGVPSMYHRLFAAFDAADDDTRARWTHHAKNLRLATSGSAALPVTLAQRWRALTGNIPLERFGMTEIGVGLTNSLDGERFPGCVGFPLPTVETRVVDGELWIRGPSVFAGYYHDEAATAKAFVDGWFRTGDTVERVEEGPFRILGRTSVDILKSGGYKISALEIEEVLRDHPAVSEVAVIGVPDPAWGDRVVACVVMKPSAVTTGEAIRAFARTRLAAYKVPKDVHFLAELPKNALGKVTKPPLMRRFA